MLDKDAHCDDHLRRNLHCGTPLVCAWRYSNSTQWRNSPLVDLQVHVTGKSYDLGDIASGAMKECKVNPTSESHVEISYRLPDGTTPRHPFDCYFESGYLGAVDAEIRDGELSHSSNQIRFSLL
jgi:hypothetical protein